MPIPSHFDRGLAEIDNLHGAALVIPGLKNICA